MQVLPADDIGAGASLTLKFAPMALFLKSGKLGPVDLFDRALERMAGRRAAATRHPTFG